MADYAIDYLAEEHAPDPVGSKGDPTPPGKIGIWLFLASEIMFFVAILGTYIIYRAGSPTFFAKNAETLNKWLAALNTVILIFSSLTMALAVDASQRQNPRRAAKLIAITLLCAFGFLGVKFIEYHSKFQHYTFQCVEGSQITLYDAHRHIENDKWVLTDGYKMKMPEPKSGHEFHLGLVVEPDFKAIGSDGKPVGEAVPDGTTIEAKNVTNAVDYGPSRNIFFSCYFTLTFIHGLHVIGGIIPLSILLLQALVRGKTFPRHTEYVGLYWHFVDLVWIFLFPLLYLI